MISSLWVRGWDSPSIHIGFPKLTDQGSGLQSKKGLIAARGTGDRAD